MRVVQHPPPLWASLATCLIVTAACSHEAGTGPIPTQVVFTSQPSPLVQGNVVMAPPIQVTVRDASGNPLSGALVTLGAVAPLSLPGLQLSGTLTATTGVNGVASFANLRINEPGEGYTLLAVSNTASGLSTHFNVGLTFTAVGAGGLHTCGVTTGGIYCWGINLYGQIGSALGLRVSSVPILVPSAVQLTQLLGGEQHSCGLVVSGAVYCWGHNDVGELGDGVTNGPDQCPGAAFALPQCALTPAQVIGSGASPLTFTAISSGPIAIHTCGVTDVGALYCWGNDYNGTLGDGGNGIRPTPVQVTGSGAAPLVFTNVSVGDGNTCGVTTDHAVYCWGNSYGSTLTKVMGSGVPPLTFTAVTARRAHACGLTSDGAAYCWGSDSQGELGDSGTNASSIPVQVHGSGAAPRVFTSIDAGDLHTCAVTSAGAVYCWGFNNGGQLGDGTTTNRATPVQVVGSGISPLIFTTVTAGEAHTCGLTTSHAVYCWGYGLDGELGNGPLANQLTPVPVVQ